MEWRTPASVDSTITPGWIDAHILDVDVERVGVIGLQVTTIGGFLLPGREQDPRRHIAVLDWQKQCELDVRRSISGKRRHTGSGRRDGGSRSVGSHP
ncbi:hypothetical protein, partial [Cutibacterium avidum]|uniref:hypothetical protein n=1 Tax=Cutibacterium avidum TaxID=33010 RepID=UPI0012BBB59C